MIIPTVTRKIFSALVFMNFVKRYKGESSLMKIKAAHFYVQGVKKTRVAFLGFAFILLSFVLLGSGLYLIHTALFTFSMMSARAKFILALSLGGAEFLGAVIILLYLFREDTWAKFSEIHKVVNSVVENEHAKFKKGNGRNGSGR